MQKFPQKYEKRFTCVKKLKGNDPSLKSLEAICAEKYEAEFCLVNFFAEGEMLWLSIHAISYSFTERV